MASRNRQQGLQYAMDGQFKILSFMNTGKTTGIEAKAFWSQAS